MTALPKLPKAVRERIEQIVDPRRFPVAELHSLAHWLMEPVCHNCGGNSRISEYDLNHCRRCGRVAEITRAEYLRRNPEVSRDRKR